MAYYTGSVTSINALRQALIDACVAEGWAWDAANSVLSKAAVFTRVTATTDSLLFLGRTSLLAGDAPNTVAIGRLCNTSGQPTFDFTWPAEYHIFVFGSPAEVYLVVRYGVDIFQWAAFGQSSVAGMSGTGMWIGATLGGQIALVLTSDSGLAYLSAQTGGLDNGSGYRYLSPAWGYSNSTTTAGSTARNLFVHSDLDAQAWLLQQSLTAAGVGVSSITELISAQPSAWNSEAALLPMRAWKVRPSNRVSLVADLSNARHIRLDNYEPTQVIEIGAERWMVFPWLRKNTAERAGTFIGGTNRLRSHSGTFGWAIRYEGP